MSWTQLNSSNPSTTPAESEKVYDKYWMVRFEVHGTDPTEPMKMRAHFLPCRDVVDGETSYKELQPNGERVSIAIDDLFAEAATDPEIASLINGILSKLVDIGKDQGIFDNDSSSSSGA